MSIIALPPKVGIAHCEWSLDRPAQINRSLYTGKRSVVANPWHGMWRARVELSPIVGEANVRDWRAFLTKLKGAINTCLLPATEGPQYVVTYNYPAITNRANTTITSLGGNVYRIEKTGGSDGVFDASGVSSVAMTGDFIVRIKENTSTAYWAMFGVNSDPLTDDNYTSIDCAVYQQGGSLSIYANGVHQGNCGSYTNSQYLFIRRVGTTISLYIGNTTDIASATFLISWPGSISSTMYFDSSLHSAGGQFDVQVSFTTNLPSVSGSSAQGNNTLPLSLDPGLKAGMMATITLPSGNRQLLMLTQDMSGGVITFEPPLREAISAGAGIEVVNPACQVALSDSAFRWNVNQGQLYGIAFDAEEAF